MKPTPQQESIVASGSRGINMKVEALAGTGKTSTLVMLAKAMPKASGLYMAFNKSIASEAGRKFPSNFETSTMHSKAFRAVGHKYANRIEGKDAGRLTPIRLVQHYGYTTMGGLAPLTRAGLVKMTLTNFLSSTRHEPGRNDLPLADITRMGGARDWTASDFATFEELIAQDARKLWQDILSDSSGLPMPHDGYFKLWVDSAPDLRVDVVMLDEAQDASDLMMQLIRSQAAQTILVGDANQQIYEWRGAVNIMQRLGDMHTEYLSQSFRFDDRIANAANQVLTHLESPVMLEGFNVDRSAMPTSRAMLFRTNSGVFGELMERSLGSKRQQVHVAGGTADLSSMLTAVEGLQRGRPTTHPDFIGYDSWDQYVDAAESYNAPPEMRLLVKVVEKYPLPKLKAALDDAGAVKEHTCDISLSTAHKAKGREWTHVAIGGDFTLPEANPLCEEKPITGEESRLQYVALTRAQVDLYGAVNMIKAYHERNQFVARLKALEGAPVEKRLAFKLTHAPKGNEEAMQRFISNLDPEETQLLARYRHGKAPESSPAVQQEAGHGSSGSAISDASMTTTAPSV